MLFRTSLSSILDGLQRSEIGLYEAGSVGVFFVLRIGMILAVFQMLGMVLCIMEWLNRLVSALMAFCPRCFRWMCDMPSGPVDPVFFVAFIASRVMVVVKGGGKFLSVVSA